MFNGTITKGHRTITITSREISVNAPGNVYPVMRLSHNDNYVLKVNKTTISTCNVEMLYYYLETSRNAFNTVYTYIKLRRYEDIDVIIDVHAITRAAFYNHFNMNEKNMNKFVEFFNSCSASTRREIIRDHITYDHEAKMNGVISISTFVGENRYCLARCKNCAAICSHCFADSLTKQRAGLKNKLQRVHAIFTRCELSADDIPVLAPDIYDENETIYKYFRFEAFGDLNNKIQVKNYNLFAKCNPNINFTLWTKNPGIIQAAINDGLQLAKNLVIGLSSLYLNTPDTKTARKYSFIRFLFTVYDDEYISAHNVVINCGARHCISCGICYDYLHRAKNTGDLYIINERLK